MILMTRLKTGIIDIGSNTIRLVLYKYSQEEGLHEFGNIKTVARLRSFINSNGEMSEEGIQLLEDTLTSFKKILDDYEITDVKAAATAAVRQAKNNKEIIERMQKTTGIRVDLLSGKEEAFYGFFAVAHSMDTPSAVTIDIGGGSTEITIFRDKSLQHSFSFPFGTVSLKQKFVSGEILNSDEKKELRQFVKKQFEKLKWIPNASLPIIAIGGSARNLAQVHQHIVDYPISGVHQYEMKKTDLQGLNYYLGNMTIEQLKQLDGLSSDRADIIGIALEVFLVLMDVVGNNSFQVSKKGLREGLIMSRVLETDSSAFDKYNVFDVNARRLTTEYGRAEEEVKNLTSLTEQLYNESCRLNLIEYNKEHFDLLIKAAKVYSIGEYIELDSSNQHTFYLLANQSIAGMNHLNRVKVALLASFKNRDYFRRFAEPFNSWMSREELKVLRDYGSILKFVSAFNVSKRNLVKTIKLEKKDNVVNIKVLALTSPTAEIYQTERQKKHIERVYKYPVKIRFIEQEGWNNE